MHSIVQCVLSLVLVFVAYRAGKAEGWRDGQIEATKAALDMIREELKDRAHERGHRADQILRGGK